MKEYDEIVTAAVTDPKNWVRDVLLNQPQIVEALAFMRLTARHTYNLLVEIALPEAGVENLRSLTTAVTAEAKRIEAEGNAVPTEAPSPITHEEMIAEFSKEIDEVTTNFSDTATLLDDVKQFLKKYVTFPSEHQAVAAALWILHVWALGAFRITPRLSVQAPQRESGKTRLLEVIHLLTPMARLWLLPSAAVVFRTLDIGPATLLIDEIDAVFRGSGAEKYDELRAIINQGYSRTGTVPRVVPIGDGKRMGPVEFPVFSAMALAGIGGLPDTIESRAVIIRLQRQKRSERASKFRWREVEGPARALTDRCTLWAGCHMDQLREARPQCPPGLRDRQEDIWEPLLAIAELAGDEWRKRAQDAAQFFAKRAEDRADDIAVVLLRDIRLIFDESGRNRLGSAFVVSGLLGIEESPWNGWGQGRRQKAGFTANDLARMLREFDIHPKKGRDGEASNNKGYERADFEDAWERYLNTAPKGEGSAPSQGPQTASDLGVYCGPLGSAQGPQNGTSAKTADPCGPQEIQGSAPETAGQPTYADPADPADSNP